MLFGYYKFKIFLNERFLTYHLCLQRKTTANLKRLGCCRQRINRTRHQSQERSCHRHWKETFLLTHGRILLLQNSSILRTHWSCLCRTRTWFQTAISEGKETCSELLGQVLLACWSAHSLQGNIRTCSGKNPGWRIQTFWSVSTRRWIWWVGTSSDSDWSFRSLLQLEGNCYRKELKERESVFGEEIQGRHGNWGRYPHSSVDIEVRFWGRDEQQ